MRRRYAALLRAISNVPMAPFRRALEELGLEDVASYATSGNLLFNAPGAAPGELERRITARLDRVTLVRTRTDLARVAAANPFPRRTDVVVLFLSRPPAAARRRAFLRSDFQPPAPVIQGRAVYYSWPVRFRGRKSPVDLERQLGVVGTFRSFRMVNRLLAEMTGT
jgi:uncharacterized protein (DUF1697 family)